jgi:ABC-2 type transport system permease protein
VVIAASLVLQGVVRDAWHLLLPAAGVSLAAMLGGCAASSYLSARIPYAVPQSRKSMFASSVAGQKGVSARATFATLGLSVLLAVPSAVAAFLAVREADWWGWVSVLLALVIGGVALVWAVRATADRYLARGPEILAVVAAGDRA